MMTKRAVANRCPVCHDVKAEGLIIACGHFCCRECMDKILNDEDARKRTCPICRTKIAKKRLFRVSAVAAGRSGAAVGDVDGVLAIPIKGDCEKTRKPDTCVNA